MEQKQDLEKLRDALGLTAEMTLIFYRAALGAGASTKEAMRLAQAYIGAVLDRRDPKNKENE